MQGQDTPAGTRHPVALQSPMDYASRVPALTPETNWRQVLSHTGATYVAVHFTKFDLGPKDYLKVSDSKGGQSFILSGRGKMQMGSFWAQHVKGDALLMELVTVGTERGQGFEIDQYSAGAAPRQAEAIARSICGFDDKDNAICYLGLPAYERGRAVARLLVHTLVGDFWGTGFLISPCNHLLSNQHVISSAYEAANTDYEFMAEAPDCYSLNCEGCYEGTIYSGAEFIQADYPLDYALVRINSGNPAAAFGYLDIDDRSPVIGEEIYIPQHPGGRAKEFAYYSSEFADVGGLCRIQSLSEYGCHDETDDVGYYADTEGGSSGSPVIASATDRVIALHHCSGCLNTAVPMQKIWRDIAYLVRMPSISAREWSAPSAGGRLIVNVSSANGCNWAGENPCGDWLTVTPLSGVGNTPVSVSAAANPNCLGRTCSLTIAGVSFTVFQNAGPGHFSISPRLWNPPADGGSIIVDVTTGDGCSWSVSNPYSDWLTIAPLEGTGSGSVTLSAGINPGCTARACPNLTIAGQHPAINQAGQQILSFSAAAYTNSEAVPGAIITVKRCGPTTSTNSVHFATMDGTAQAPSDYRSTNGTLRFGIGEVSKTFTVALVNNTLDRTNKTVSLRLTEPTGGALLGAQSHAVLTIANDDKGGVVRFAAGSYSVGESAGHATITVLRAGGLAGGVAVDYATSNGSATEGLDYTNTFGTLVFNANETIKTITVPIISDTIDETNETVLLTLSNPMGGAVLGAPNVAVLTIIDDDTGGTLAFSAARYSISETGTLASVTVTRSGGAASGVTVDYAATDGTATDGLDYLAASGTLSFGAGELTRTFAVTNLDDDLPDGDKTVLLTLRNPTGGAKLGAISNAVLTIVDNEVGLQFSRASFTNSEGVGAALLSVVRSGPTTGTVTVAYFTQDGTASSNFDYQAKSGTLTFGPGVISQNISLRITNDTAVESNETVMVCLANPGGGALLASRTNAILWLVDNDLGGVIGFSATNYTVGEANPKAAITILRSGGLASGVTVDFTTADGTATEGLDYSNSTQTVSFRANETVKTILVPIRNDTLDEPNETILLSLRNPTGGASLGARTNAILTILDDDVAGLIAFSLARYSMSETAALASITVIRSGGAASGVTVDYGTYDGTAMADHDYLATSGTLTFAAGEASKTFTVTNLDDNVAEGDESIVLVLTNATGGARLGAISNAVLTIVDNEVGLQFSRANYTNNEATAAALLTVIRSGPVTGTVTVGYFTQDGTASSNSDYRAKSGTLTFGPNVTSQNISLMITNDTMVESNETVMVCLANPGGGAMLGSRTNATVWIIDNDHAGAIGLAAANAPSRMALTPPRFEPNGSFSFKFTGKEGVRYVIQASSNLLQWENVTTNTTRGESLNFIEVNARQAGQRFYRLKWVP